MLQELEEVAVKFGKTVAKLGRDVKHWDAWGSIKGTIEAFKKTMPLISDLRNSALRPRHWTQLMTTIHTHFDPTSDSFTLDSIVQLRLDQHADYISEMSLNATKELAIEQSLTTIAETWKGLLLDMVRFRVCEAAGAAPPGRCACTWHTVLPIAGTMSRLPGVSDHSGVC